MDNFFYNIFIKCRNVDKGRGGGSTNVDKDFCMFKAFLMAFLAFLMHIWLYLAYFYPKQKKQIKKYLHKIVFGNSLFWRGEEIIEGLG